MKKNKLISKMLVIPMVTSLFMGFHVIDFQTVKASSLPISNNLAFTSQDIGSVGIPGSAIYNSSANEFTVAGSGITSPATLTTADPDGLQFVGLSSMRNGDSTIIAKIKNFDIGGASAPTLGVMVRSTMDSTSNYAASIIKPTSSSNGTATSYLPIYQYRDLAQNKPTTSGPSTGTAISTADDGSFYLKIEYIGTATNAKFQYFYAFLGKVDTSGNIQWTIAKTGTHSTITSSYYIGLAVSSNDTSKTVTANFDNVTILNSCDVNTKAYTCPPTSVSSLDSMAAPTWAGKGTLTPVVSAVGDCTLNWNAAYDNVGITKYNIYEGSNFVGSTVDGSTTTFTVKKSSTFDPTTNAYAFSVQAVDLAGNNSTDGPNTSSDIIPPTWTSGVLKNSTVAQNRINLSWSGAKDNTGVTSYKIYDITDSTKPALIATVDGSATSYSVTNLNSSTAYNFKVEAGDSSGNWSNDGPSLSVSTTAPIDDKESPTWSSGKLSVTNLSQTGATLTWSGADDNVGIAGYNIYQGSSATPIATLSGTQNTYNVTTLTPATSYTFSVQAVDEAGNISTTGPNTKAVTPSIPTWQSGTLSASSSITTQPNTAGPIYTAVQNDSTTLTWSGASDPIAVTSYNILQKGKVIATVDGTTNTYTVAGLTPGEVYNFEVEAVDNAGCISTNGPTVAVTMVSADSALLPPQSLSVPTLAYDDTSITLVWTKPDNYATANIADYNIYMDGKNIGDANNNTASAAKSFVDNFYTANSSAEKISNHSYTVTGLKPNTSHSFTVRSVDSNGKESADSNTVTQVTNPTPQVFDVTKYGAVGDGTTIDTLPIQAAIDACTAGGKVLLPAGKTFKSGSLWIKNSDITFEVDGKLLASDNAADFPYPDSTFKTVVKTYSLINAICTDSSLKNIKITGTGTIDGNGWKQGTPDADGFPQALASSSSTVTTNGMLAAAQVNLAKTKGFSDADAYSTRSNLISITGVTNVYFGGGLSLVNPSQHTLSVGSNNVTLNGVKILTYDCNNGDGIDMSGSGLTVVNSVFDTGDDDVNFAAGTGLAAEARPPVQNAWIFDNYFRHGHGAVVAGSNTAAWIQNILAEDNVMNGTGVGLRCKTGLGTGGGARNIVFRDSAMKNITDGDQFPFEFTSAYPGSAADPAPDMGQFKHIFVNNVTVDTSTKSAIFVSGDKTASHGDIHFTNVAFTNTPAVSISYLKNSSFNNVKLSGVELTSTAVAATNSTGLTFDSSFAGSDSSVKDFTVNSTFNLSSLEPEKMLDVQTAVTNNKSSLQSVLVTIALYDENEKMVNMSYISKNIPIGDTENLSAGFKLPSNTTNYKAKVFVWDGTSLETSTMQPISNVVTLP